MVVLDSTFLIDFLRSKPSAILMAKEFADNVFTTRLNVFEILVGIYRKKPEEQQKHLAAFYELLHSLQVLELDEKSASEAAHISAELMQKGKMLDEIDILVASIAIVHGEKTIITENIKHFSKIPGIKVEGY